MKLVRWYPLVIGMLVAAVLFAFIRSHNTEDRNRFQEAAAKEVQSGTSQSHEPELADPILLADMANKGVVRHQSSPQDGIRVIVNPQFECNVSVRAVSLDQPTRAVLSMRHLDREAWLEVTELCVTRITDREWQIGLENTEHAVGIVTIADYHYADARVIDLSSAPVSTIISVNLQQCSAYEASVESDTGAAVPDATVLLRLDDLGLSASASIPELFLSRWFSAQATTDSDGVAKFASYPRATLSVYVAATPGRSAAMAWEQASDSRARLVTFPAFSIEGRVSTIGGEPIADAQVVAIETDYSWSEEPLTQTSTSSDGSYRLDGVPDHSRPLLVRAIHDGYTSDATILVRNKSQSIEMINLELSRALPGIIQVLSGFGKPISSKSLTVYEVQGTRLPYIVSTDENGIAHLPVSLREGGEYYAMVDLGGYWMESKRFGLPASGGEPVVVTLDRVGCVTGVDCEGGAIVTEDALFTWCLDQGEPMSIEFRQRDCPKLLPAGVGRLYSSFPDGNTLSSNLIVEEKADQRVLIASSSCTWSFDLPEVEIPELRIYSTNNIRHATIMHPQGRQTISIAPGNYFIYVSSAESAAEIGPFTIPEGGLWMDELDLDGTSSIGGIVVDEAEEPIAGIPVHATAESGYTLQSVATDRSGNFSFRGIPPGEYHVSCEVGRFTGGRASDCSVSTFVGCGASVNDLKLRVIARGAKVYFHARDGELQGGRAFIVADNELRWTTGSRAASVTFPFDLGNQQVLAGMIFPIANGVEVHLETLASGESEYHVYPQVLSKYSVPRFPYSYSVYPVQIADKHIGTTGVVVPESQSVDVYTNMPALVSLFLRVDPSSSAGWQSVLVQDDATPRLRKVLVSASDGQPIAGAVAIARESGTRAITNSSGEAEIWTRRSDWIWVDHSKFWAQQFSADFLVHRVQLRSTTSAVLLRIASPDDAAIAVLAPLFNLGYDFWTGEETLIRRGREWLVPRWPVGTYTLRIIASGGGRTISEQTVELPERGEYVILR